MPLEGVYTALITPTVGRGEIDWETYERLLDLQAEANVSGVVVGGTTGESPTLETQELRALVDRARERLPGRVEVVAGVGRNRLASTLELTQFAQDLGLQTVMLVDPYYNAPSSIEIRREYFDPVSERFPEMGLMPYVVPSRTGTRLEPIDIARLLDGDCRIVGVKDATGDDLYARDLRRRSPNVALLSGDDSRTLSMMADPAIRANGVVSVVSNLVPAALVRFVRSALSADWPSARRQAASLTRLFSTVTIRAVERTTDGEEFVARSRNPVPIKSAMALLGAPVGQCRPPMGRLTPSGLRQLARALSQTSKSAPDAFRPFAERFGVDIDDRLKDRTLWPELSYALG